MLDCRSYDRRIIQEESISTRSRRRAHRRNPQWSGLETPGMREAKCSLLIQENSEFDPCTKELPKQRVLVSNHHFGDDSDEQAFFVDFEGCTVLQLEPSRGDPSIPTPQTMPILLTVGGRCSFTPESYDDFEVLMRTREQSREMNLSPNGNFDWPDVEALRMCPFCGREHRIPHEEDDYYEDYWMVFYPLLQITIRNGSQLVLGTRTICRLACEECLEKVLEGKTMNVRPSTKTGRRPQLSFELPAQQVLDDAGPATFLENGPPLPHTQDYLDAWTLYNIWEHSGAWDALQKDYRGELSRIMQANNNNNNPNDRAAAAAAAVAPTTGSGIQQKNPSSNNSGGDGERDFDTDCETDSHTTASETAESRCLEDPVVVEKTRLPLPPIQKHRDCDCPIPCLENDVESFDTGDPSASSVEENEQPKRQSTAVGPCTATEKGLTIPTTIELLASSEQNHDEHWYCGCCSRPISIVTTRSCPYFDDPLFRAAGMLSFLALLVSCFFPCSFLVNAIATFLYWLPWAFDCDDDIRFGSGPRRIWISGMVAFVANMASVGVGVYALVVMGPAEGCATYRGGDYYPHDPCQYRLLAGCAFVGAAFWATATICLALFVYEGRHSGFAENVAGDCGYNESDSNTATAMGGGVEVELKSSSAPAIGTAVPLLEQIHPIYTARQPPKPTTTRDV